MRLTTITLLVLGLLLILILLFPALFLEAASTVIPEPYGHTAGMMLAGFSMATGRPMAAAGVYDLLLVKHPESGDLYRLKGEALMEAGDIPGALLATDAALARDPANALLMIKKLRILLRQGKGGESEQMYQEILALRTDNPVYQAAVADVAIEKGRYLEAYNRYNTLLSSGQATGQIYEKQSDIIFVLLTTPTASASAPASLKSTDLYTPGMNGYERAVQLNPERREIIRGKMEKRSEEMVAHTIHELEERYQKYRYLQPGELPFTS